MQVLSLALVGKANRFISGQMGSWLSRSKVRQIVVVKKTFSEEEAEEVEG